MLLSFPATAAGAGGLLANWWDEIDESVQWQDGIFFSLCAAFALVSAVALVSRFYRITVSILLLPLFFVYETTILKWGAFIFADTID